jgi:hypothetical protein
MKRVITEKALSKLLYRRYCYSQVLEAVHGAMQLAKTECDLALPIAVMLGTIRSRLQKLGLNVVLLPNKLYPYSDYAVYRVSWPKPEEKE